MSFSLPKSLFARITASSAVVVPTSDEGSFSHVLNRDLYKQRDKIVDDDSLEDHEPFPLLSGENIEYIGRSYDNFIIAISNYRLFATVPNGFHSVPLGLVEVLEMQTTKDSFGVVCKDGRMLRLHFSSVAKCRSWYDRLLECKRRPHKDIKTVFAFIYRAYRKDEKLSRFWIDIGGDGMVLLDDTEFGEPCEARDADDACEACDTSALLSLPSDPSSWRDEVMTSEYRRMGMCQMGNENRIWRISECNDKYSVCSTYPKLLLVPGMVSDEDLKMAAKFRMSGRLPVVSWRHQSNGCVIVRSSQPLVGVFGWRSPFDEKLLLAFSQSCVLSGPQSADTVIQNGVGTCNGVSNGGLVLREDLEKFSTDSDEEGTPCFNSGDEMEGLPKMKVFDLRSYTAALGNRAKGGGCECTDYYPNCEICYKGLPNIHAVRKSFQQMRSILISEDQTNHLSNLESTQWLSYLSQLLGVASEVVGVINHQHSPSPVLVHCSDGWDRTTQIITLAEIMLDPYYRTIEGFRVLVEREWVGFGHRFSDRCGHMSEETNSRSPIFIQWLDCVYQLLTQFPCDFQFNQHFLVKLGEHCFSCLYGTFLCNSMKEREEHRVAEDTTPVWALLHEDNPEITNYLYQASERVMSPATGLKHIKLWHEMYLSPLTVGFSSRPRSPSNIMTQPLHISRPSSIITQSTPDTVTDSNHFSIPMTSKTTTNTANHFSHRSQSDSGQLSEVKHESIPSEQKPSSLVAVSVMSGMESESESLEQELKLGALESESWSESQHDPLHQENAAPTVPPADITPLSQSPDNQTAMSLEDSLITLNHSIHKECEQSHENLHGTHLEAMKNDAMTDLKEGVPLGNGHLSSVTENYIPVKSQFQQLSLNTEDNNPQSSSKTSSLKLLNLKENGVLNFNSPNKSCNGSLLQEAMEDISPCIQRTTRTSTLKAAIGDNLGLDGLPLLADKTQLRLRELAVESQREMKRLRSQLKDLQLLVQQQGVRGGGVRLVEGDGGGTVSIEDQISNTLDDQSPTSLGSWDCVEHEEGVGVRWVPDHAVSHCQGCGLKFWTGLRKHHCRSCGGVFCGNCSNFFCPVPHEQLFQDTRVCEKCFYKLDGHLRSSKDQLPVSPT